MTLRDYFAAHAPTEPLGWFEPRMPPQPEPAYDHDHPGDRCYSMIDGSQLCAPVNAAERRAWRDEYNRQYSVQWPYAWADAQLAVREQK